MIKLLDMLSKKFPKLFLGVVIISAPILNGVSLSFYTIFQIMTKLKVMKTPKIYRCAQLYLGDQRTEKVSLVCRAGPRANFTIAVYTDVLFSVSTTKQAPVHKHGNKSYMEFTYATRISLLFQHNFPGDFY